MRLACDCGRDNTALQEKGARVLHPEIFFAVVQKRLNRAMEDSMFSNLLWRLKKVS